MNTILTIDLSAPRKMIESCKSKYDNILFEYKLLPKEKRDKFERNMKIASTIIIITAVGYITYNLSTGIASAVEPTNASLSDLMKEGIGGKSQSLIPGLPDMTGGVKELHPYGDEGGLAQRYGVEFAKKIYNFIMSILKEISFPVGTVAMTVGALMTPFNKKRGIITIRNSGLGYAIIQILPIIA